jgi:hypothetical protein
VRGEWLKLSLSFSFSFSFSFVSISFYGANVGLRRVIICQRSWRSE